jgi:hypothetical protein
VEPKFLCREETSAWLTDAKWVVFSLTDDFSEYLENTYFAPGTPKNAEFEVLTASVAVNSKCHYFLPDTGHLRIMIRLGQRYPSFMKNDCLLWWS